MTRYVLRRVLLLIPVIFGVITLAFILLHLTPGDPARTLLGPKATDAAVSALRHQWGLDQPLVLQYLNYLGQTVTGNLGESIYFRSSVVGLMATRLPVTIALMLLGSVFSVLISVPLAVLSAAPKRNITLQVVRGFNAIVQGMPSFFIGSMLIVLLGVQVRLFPAGGYGVTFGDHLYALILPSLTIALGIVPLLVRSLRTSMIEVQQSEFVAFGKAKGLSRWRVLTGYSLRNGSISGISILGVQVGTLAGGALVVEQVFALPGMGSLLLTGIFSRDYLVVQACTLGFAVLVVVVYLLTDVAYALLDPRVRLS